MIVVGLMGRVQLSFLTALMLLHISHFSLFTRREGSVVPDGTSLSQQITQEPSPRSIIVLLKRVFHI